MNAIITFNYGGRPVTANVAYDPGRPSSGRMDPGQPESVSIIRAMYTDRTERVDPRVADSLDFSRAVFAAIDADHQHLRRK